MILLAIFLPPFYFLFKRHWAGFIGTLILFGLAIYSCITIIFAPLLIGCWLLASAWALLHLRFSVRRQSLNLSDPTIK